ncbi:ABC transporter permease [Amycolatopsis regifaucium]|uniref:ABC transporter permease n=1 Tax=Amycolatopsis regifaucium TaxID=546365 RepID=A0A154MAR1_9PSEU|nr:ABC transporter permease [Amycolatopsis regifaucium]KZB81738.1 ABC transporter permease [Amycolatopsis regifaucium]OKA06196.1 ABC transporter permease [Amycolatopsis regifaucium]SFG69814.1 ABC-2 type transport system permease protein [Amycolatopsis regifaucium]
MTATLDRPAHAAGSSATRLVGTWQLTRLALRRDRIILTVWVFLLGIAPSSTAGTFETLYPTAAERAGLTASMGANPSIAVIYGPAFDLSTAGGFTAWRLGGFLALLVALMAVFTVTRHTRAEEDSGRAELLASAVVGRYAALTAAVLVAGGASVLIGLIETGLMIGAKMPSAGALALGGATAATGLVFTAVAAVAVQVAEYSRTANGIGATLVGVAFLLRAVGDSTADAGWVSWLSPLGWAQQLRPFADERWWVFLLPLATAVVVGAIGYALIPRRDVGTGLLPPRPGPAVAASSLRSPFALAWRLHRGPLIGWLIGTAICAGVFGSVANGISDIVGQSEQARQIFQRMGGTDALVDAFMAAMAGMFAMVVALYGVQAALRIRAEETAVRVEPLLATGVGRLRVLWSHLVFAFGGTALMMLVSGVLLGLTNGMRAGDVGGSVGDLVVASLAQLPAVWVIVGLAVTLFGLAPKFSTAAWAIAGLALLLSLFGPVLNLPRVLLDASPFSHVPKLPAAEFTATPLSWLAGVAAVALAAGVVGWRRRDVG